MPTDAAAEDIRDMLRESETRVHEFLDAREMTEPGVRPPSGLPEQAERLSREPYRRRR
jgi:hypothetical protein